MWNSACLRHCLEGLTIGLNAERPAWAWSGPARAAGDSARLRLCLEGPATALSPDRQDSTDFGQDAQVATRLACGIAFKGRRSA